ncbi:MAG: succinylglutamate desuccinylase/aspartoacylase family protein [Candidatus Nanohaloarchaea archaeon]
MRVERRGEENPEYTVSGCIHGDEPCGKEAIERFLDKEWEFRKPVQFLVANQRALEKGERFTEVDLNRSFPGNLDSENYEERLAAKILEKVKGTKVLDVHSTKSFDRPFANHSRKNTEVRSLIESTGVDYSCHFPVSVGALNEQVDGVTLEAGEQGTGKAAENAYRVMKNFLASEGVIEQEFETSSPEHFKRIGTVMGDWEFVAENFEKVDKGEVFARGESEEMRAEKEFYPVLMSTSGYDGMLGHKAKKMEWE